MGNVRSEAPLGLSGYACEKTKVAMLFFTLKNVGNAQNTLQKSQIFFLWSLLKKLKNGEKTASENLFGLSDTHVRKKQRSPRYSSRRNARETPRIP